MRKLTKTAAVVASMAVMAMGTTLMASAATEGWVQSGSNWYYYIKGDKAADQWVQAGDDWYFVDDEGKMVKNTFVRIDKYDNSSEVLDDQQDIYASLGQNDIDDDSEFYYMGADGKMVTGWKEFKASNIYASPNSSKASTVWYYFGASGRMYVNEWLESSGVWYALSANGQMYAEAVVNNDLVDWDDTDNYYMDKNGALVKGWYKTTESIAGSAPESVHDSVDIVTGDADDEATNQVFFNKKDLYVYGDPDTGVLAEKEWKEISGKYYFFGVEAETNTNKDSGLELITLQKEGDDLAAADVKIGEGFVVSGSAISGITEDPKKEVTARDRNAMYSDVFVRWTNHKNETEYFYLNKNGDALTTWKELDDDFWIYGNSKGELYYDEVALINGRYYYFDSTGICDSKYLNNTVDYVVIIEPEKGGKSEDGERHITTAADSIVMYETSGSKIPYEGDDNNEAAEICSIADMKKALAEDGADYTIVYKINNRRVAVKSMTDNEVILAYTAHTENKYDTDITVYKLRTSASISGKVSKMN